MAKQGLKNLLKVKSAVASLKDGQSYSEKRGSVSFFWKIYHVYFF